MSTSVTVTTSPTKLCDAKDARRRNWVVLQVDANEDTDPFIGIGNASVTPSTGVRLRRGFSRYIANEAVAKPAESAIYACTSAGTCTIIVDEGT
jgi:hypothetical protein